MLIHDVQAKVIVLATVIHEIFTIKRSDIPQNFGFHDRKSCSQVTQTVSSRLIPRSFSPVDAKKRAILPEAINQTPFNVQQHHSVRMPVHKFRD